MGGTRGTKDGAGPRRARLEGGWTVHKTQEDEEKKMRGQSGGEPPADGKGRANREGRHRRDEERRAEKLLISVLIGVGGSFWETDDTVPWMAVIKGVVFVLQTGGNNFNSVLTHRGPDTLL
ncbi:hypothetical protein CRENBAI_009037 [Crenichthys baileyi]|uniref:Uncharacterized protein n=1 Tax=Crenichthys baileyi TaxID=28760 RepID=A0AAV9QUG0_9TELE